MATISAVYAALLSCQYCLLCMCYFTSVSWQINDDDDDLSYSMLYNKST